MGFAPSTMQLSTSAFAEGSAIPSQFTGEGKDISPAFTWSQVPAGTKEFAIICHDPDAPLVSANGTYGFVHWVLYNIPGENTALEEGDPRFTKGTNNFGNLGYGGPMPPERHGPHRYYFWVLALDKEMDLPEGLSMWELLEKIEPSILGMSRIVGTYERS